MAMSEGSSKRKRVLSDEVHSSNKRTTASRPSSDITVKFLPLESEAPHVIVGKSALKIFQFSCN